MELKVWCEGIQRIICGATETTTCQDVVVALAQASGKTGRYTLVEKWRETERLVAPNENPILSLQKWGEYASDVQFILRHSGGKSRPGSHRSEKSGSDSRRTSKLLQHNFTPHLSESRRSSSTSSLKKSLTFSGAHSYSSLVPKNHHHDKNGSLPEDSSLESLTDKGSQVSQSSRSTFMNSSAYSSLETSRRVRLPDSVSSQSSVSSLEPRSKSSVPNHVQSTPHGNTPFSYTGGKSVVGGSLDRTRKRHDPNRISPHSRQFSSSSVQSMSSNPPNFSPSKPQSSSTRSRSPLPNHLQKLSLPKESNNNIDFKPNANLTSVQPERSQNSAEAAAAESEETKKRAELMKLINSQKEKLKKQEDGIESLQREIASLEPASVDSSQVSPSLRSSLKGDLALLEKRESELDNDIQELELVSWEDKLAIEKNKQERFHGDIQSTKGEVKQFEHKLNAQQNKIQQLEKDLTAAKEEAEKKAKQDKDSELKVLQEISDLQKQINSQLVSHEEKQGELEKVEGEVKQSQKMLLERKTQLADLEKELKHSNVEQFKRVPADWLRSSKEGPSKFDRVSPARPGSARRLESPQRLKEAAITAKNPQGLWV